MFNWDAWYSDQVHHLWTMNMYFDIFIYGIIWKSRFDMAYAIGYFCKTFFELSLEEALAAKASTPIWNKKDFFIQTLESKDLNILEIS